MRFASTRGGAGEVSFREAVFQGLAPDGGLYHPVDQPDLGGLFRSFSPETPFTELAGEVASALLGDELGGEEVLRIVRRAFSFQPVLKELEEDIELLELFHGPTCAFKDFGACFLASTMEELLAREGRKAVILTATSGDTGSAVARAFHGMANLKVVVLYPSGRVSRLQEQQLATLGGNVFALEVKGSFDDCQRLAKQAFLDRKLKEELGLTSANSINLGRLLPQAFYYIYARLRLGIPGPGPFFFCVPSGNFGNLTAGIYAWQWGLPVEGFIAATNVNDVVPEYLRTGLFTPRPSVPTISNAMDVGDPSNFERMRAVFNGDASAMAALIAGQRVTDPEARAIIRDTFKRTGVLVDPHTAVALAAVEALHRRGLAKGRVVVLATAHPGKFRETVEAETGAAVSLPPALKAALEKPKRSIPLANSFPELAAFLRSSF